MQDKTGNKEKTVPVCSRIAGLPALYLVHRFQINYALLLVYFSDSAMQKFSV